MEIATSVLPLFAGNDQYEVMSCEVTENRLYLKVVNHRLEMEVCKGDIVQAGVMISNSEVGLGAVSIQPLVEYYEKNGMRWDFGMVVINELSSFKNYQFQRFKFLRKVRLFVKRWVGLTGTPSSNGLMDLWAEIGILDGGERLGKFIGRYREAYFRAASKNPATGVVYQYQNRRQE